ncbi:uncharacterized protein TrAtP1_011708 [Trichoderma atroviride]|uniref:uncharacterized protein n=1 Tax=Hypocrea atroviridis TaxID=63577 RepID=UPI00332EBA2D|nr:hypothetical protein TrAtP1_011708 [Trichoderma atroviride]
MREMGVELGWKSRRAATGQAVRNKPADVEIKLEWMLDAGWDRAESTLVWYTVSRRTEYLLARPLGLVGAGLILQRSSGIEYSGQLQLFAAALPRTRLYRTRTEEYCKGIGNACLRRV